MTNNKLLIGSLSNDLMRIANSSYKGNYKTAQRFWVEAQRWISDLKTEQNKEYIQKIVNSLDKLNFNPQDMKQAEDNLMYSVLLQNYTLKID